MEILVILTNYIKPLNDIVWGPAMLVLILGTGIYLMLGLRLIPFRKLIYGFRMLWQGRTSSEAGDITPFNALMTSLSATIGTGNIAGVATAIVLGGPGALFWMWCTALVGMATKYGEAVCAVHYREKDEAGNHIGGPMYYIKNGLKSHWTWLGTAFAIIGAVAGFGIGNTVQANSVADVLKDFGVPVEVTGVVLAVLVGLVLIGGIRWIAEVAGKLVPIMGIAYVTGGLVILIIHADKIPQAFNLIFTYAFTPVAATGGFAGAAVWAAIRFGVARGIFSNEAGLGSAPIAQATARTNSPVRQGVIAMLETFIDTIIVCTITGLVIIISGAWTSGATGASLSSAAFEQALPSFGGYVVAFASAIFAFTTLLGWSFYGEKCVQYLFGFKSITPFRLLWVLVIPIGAISELNFVWLVADTLNALMAIPNLIALILLSPVIFKLTRDYFHSTEVSR
ncbi:MAG TPA: sodium:alanine symporter family protein [Thioploca sp.]|nr:sodium:alanine symporter family protein [Thioploca sp.]